MSRAELLLLWVSCTALTVHTRDAARRWAAQPHLSTDGLCRYGNSMECCWGWTRTDQGGCKPHCQQECKHGVCVGPDRCQCDPGYTGKTCNQDLNECGLRPRPCKHRCMNTVGSYKCYCLDGYTLHQDGGCRDTRNCFYANCQYGCEVVKGDVRCTCPSPGLRLGPDRRTCVDIDECVQRRGVCPRDRKCVNTFGSFLCNCPHGLRLVYIKGRYTCTDKDTRPFCALNPFSPKCRRCRGRHCRDVPLVTLLPPPAPRTTKPAPPRTTATPATPRPPYRKTTASRTTPTRTTAGTATSTASSTASTLLQPNTTPTATVSVATTAATTTTTTAVTVSPAPVTTATPQIFTTSTSESTTVPDLVSAATTAATTTVHVFTTANATSIPSATTITATSTATHAPSTTTACTPTPSSAVSTTTAPPPTPSTAVSTTAAPPPTPSTAVSTTTTAAPPTTSTVTTTTSTPRPSSTATSSSTTTPAPLSTTTTEGKPPATIATATGSSIPITTSGGAMTTTLDNRINKDLTQRPRGDVHIPRQDTQVWEFDIELGNTAEMRDDPASGLLHCSMDRGVCDWLSDREGDVDWNTVQSTSGGWYLSVAELKAGQRSVRGARLAVALAPPRNQEEMCFSFSHWLTGHHVGGLQLFVRKTGSRYSPALWSRTEGQGWKTTLVKLERDTERVLLRAERRRGQKGQIAVDDITLKSGPCR